MQKELLTIWGSNKATIIFITHSIEEAVLLSDRVIVMGNGKVLTDTYIETPRDQRNTDNTQFVDYVNYFKNFIQEN